MGIAFIGPPPWHYMKTVEYERAIVWLCQNCSALGGWPPREISKVAGWLCVRLVAHLFDRTPRQVAMDLIDFDLHQEDDLSV